MARSVHMPLPHEILPGRADMMPTASHHHVTGLPLKGPFGADDARLEKAYLALGCFWGAERKFWQTAGVVATSVGYAGGTTPNPTYRQVCTGQTGHTEVVEVVFDPAIIDFAGLLKVFFESHDPTQGMGQGNDIGTQYRSAILTLNDDQAAVAHQAVDAYQPRLSAKNYGKITTEIVPLATYYYAEDYHQQYLSKNPGGYCGLGGTGVDCPIGVLA